MIYYHIIAIVKKECRLEKKLKIITSRQANNVVVSKRAMYRYHC